MSKKRKVPEINITETPNAVLCDCNLFPYLVDGVGREYLKDDPDMPPMLAAQMAVSWVTTQMRVLLEGSSPHDAWSNYDDVWVSVLKRIVNGISEHYKLPIGENYSYKVEPITGPSLCIVYRFKGVLQ
ncbi:hypothetical protein [Erwinia phage vB_Ea277G]|jgi:hypothetical protein|nr:hypothetical protein [Erwinia phage vB_Ea277G]